MKRILYILSGNLSTTPRAWQSIKTAQGLFQVNIIGVNRLNHWRKIDQILVDTNNLIYQAVSLLRKPFFPWLKSTLVHEASKFLYPLFSKNIRIAAYSSAKTMYLLEKEVLRNKVKYDLILAHSYSSLYPAYKLAKELKIPFAFDIEDYHPGEKCSPAEKKRGEFLMKKLLPKATYLTYASPLIGKQTLKLLTGTNIPENTLINNCFSQFEFEFKENRSDKIQFVWFSQNIAPGRGLELVLLVLYKFKEYVQLILVGNLYQQFYNGFLVQYSDILQIIEPIPQAVLNKYICSFDIGLAIEQKTSDFNRDICLTNKIFAYSQAGLYILATDTSGQKQFMEEHSGLGIVSGQSTGEVEKAVEYLIENIETIRKEKKARFEYAKKLSWEVESRKLVKIWGNVLK